MVSQLQWCLSYLTTCRVQGVQDIWPKCQHGQRGDGWSGNRTDGETINLSDCERKLLMRGPGYCILKSVKEEGFCCALEECIVKQKWECLNEEEDEEPPCLEVPSPEELKELERIQALAEEMVGWIRFSKSFFCIQQIGFSLLYMRLDTTNNFSWIFDDLGVPQAT